MEVIDVDSWRSCWIRDSRHLVECSSDGLTRMSDTYGNFWICMMDQSSLPGTNISSHSAESISPSPRPLDFYAVPLVGRPSWLSWYVVMGLCILIRPVHKEIHPTPGTLDFGTLKRRLVGHPAERILPRLVRIETMSNLVESSPDWLFCEIAAYRKEVSSTSLRR
jgi:hypothetical protein